MGVNWTYIKNKWNVFAHINISLCD